jgi:hypothetical protein
MRSKQFVGALSAAILVMGVGATSSFAIAGGGPGGGPGTEQPGDDDQQQAPGDDQNGESGDDSDGQKAPKPPKPRLIDLVIDSSDDLAETTWNADDNDDVDVDSDWACKRPSFKKKQKKVVVKCYGEIWVTVGENESKLVCGNTKVTIRKGTKRPKINTKWFGKRAHAKLPNATHEDPWCAKYEKYSDLNGFKAEPPTDQPQGDEPSGDEPAADDAGAADES